MGAKLCWTGLLILLAGGTLHVPAAEAVGAVVMLLGVIAVWLDK